MEPETKIDEYLEYKMEEYKTYNFCRNYKLNDNIKEDIFNKKYSHPKFIHVFHPDNDYTERFFKAIDYRIKDKNNMVLSFDGEPNLGKSEGGTTTAKYMEKGFLELLNKKVKIHLGFSTMEFDSIIRNMKEGDIAIRDESPKASGTGSRNITQNLNNITQIVRAHQNFFIFICPKRIEADVITYYLEAGGKNKQNRTLRFILYDPSFQDGKIPIGRVYLKLHEDEKFREEYEKRKDANIGLIKKHGGGVFHEIDSIHIKNDFIKLFNYCKIKNAFTRANIKTQLSNHNIECELNNKASEIITGDTDYEAKLIQNVYNAFKHPESLPEYLKELISEKIKKKTVEVPDIQGLTKSSGFIEFLEEYYSSNLPETITIGTSIVKREEIIDVLKSWASGIGIREISHSNDNLHQGLVQDIIKLFKDGKRHSTSIEDDWRVYRCYEFWCSKKYNLELVSGHKQPDFVKNINKNKIAGECKFWDDIKKNIAVDKRKKFHVHENYQHLQDSFPVLFRNVKWGDNDYLYIVSMNSSNTFNFEKKEQFIISDEKQIIDYYKKNTSEVKNNGKKEERKT